MARLLTTGFELNDLASAAAGHPDPLIATNATLVSANPRSGTYHGRCAYTGGAGFYFEVAQAQTTAVTYWFRAAFSLNTLPAGTPGTDLLALFQLRTSSASLLAINVSGDGTFYRASSPIGGRVAAGNYFVLEVKTKIDTASGANSLVEVLLNGISLYTAAGDLGTTLGDRYRVGAVIGSGAPGSVTVDVDDVAINDSSGAAQNSSTGIGKIVLLKPTADSAGGTGWTLGTGTALGGNGFAAEGNTPPIGVADLAAGSDTKQIRNATSNANVNYDATMTTYTAAGINTGSVVNVIVPIISTAAPVSTSAKQGTVGVSTNPVIANVALGAGGTAGAFWSGTAAGTYPTGWKWSFGTITYAPAVTLGTAPVMRITQVTSSTRIAMVDFMGMYVDYTPASSEVLEASLLRRSTSRRGNRTVKV